MTLKGSALNTEQKIKAFNILSNFLKQFSGEPSSETMEEELSGLNSLYAERFDNAIKTAFHYNGWFTETNVRNSIASIAENLEESKLRKWSSPYSEEISIPKNSKRIGVIMAGNIPLAGFHDFICVLMAGHIFVGKLSSQDKILLPLIADILCEIDKGFQNQLAFTERKMTNFDAVIATGSNNTSRYFEYYFGKYPNIIRKNRNSVALLNGEETHMNLFHLGYDIFQYFGLGCRNVSKIFIPEGFNFDKFFKGIYEHQGIINNHKYANNYQYNKTLYLLNSDKLLDNGFIILKEENKTSSPVGVLFYEYYDDLEKVEDSLKKRLNTDIQCVVSGIKSSLPVVNFGKAQSPSFSDYADGVDVMKFLTKLK